MGKVKPESQKRTGGCVVVAHLENWSTRKTRSRVHEARGLREGYAWRGGGEGRMGGRRVGMSEGRGGSH